MAASTLTYQPPALWLIEPTKSPTVRYIAPATGHTGTAVIQPSDLVTVGSGVLTRAATNTASGIAGIVPFGETQIWGQPGGSSTTNVGPNQLFGYSQAGTLLPSDSLELAVNSLDSIWLEMSLVNSVQYTSDAAIIGLAVGLLLDTGTNLFVADSTQSNKVGTVRGKVVGPNIFLPSGTVLGKGQINDFGVRVLVQFTVADLA